MITPIEIQNKNFKSGGLGYDKKDVDGFMKDVLKGYEIIYRENMEMKDKITVLNDGIQYYKTIEKTLQKALVLAEKTADDTRAAAHKEAKTIEKEAQTKAQLIVADAKNELERIHNQTINIIQQYEKYKAQFKNLAAAQIEVLESDSFSINVARLETFIPGDKELNQNHSKKAYNIDLKKVAREQNLIKRSNTQVKMSEVLPDGQEEYQPYSEDFEAEASVALESLDNEELTSIEDFNFMSIEEDDDYRS